MNDGAVSEMAGSNLASGSRENELHEQPTCWEAAFRLGNGDYLYIQTCDTGYDYTLYDSNFRNLDGGQLDNPSLSMDAARKEILAIQGLSQEHWEALSSAELEQRWETAAP